MLFQIQCIICVFERTACITCHILYCMLFFERMKESPERVAQAMTGFSGMESRKMTHFKYFLYN